MLTYDALMADLQIMFDRQQFVCRHVPPCPKCGERMQMQVTDYLSTPAKWKCRMCKYRFVHEPAVE